MGEEIEKSEKVEVQELGIKIKLEITAPYLSGVPERERSLILNSYKHVAEALIKYIAQDMRLHQSGYIGPFGIGILLSYLAKAREELEKVIKAVSPSP